MAPVRECSPSGRRRFLENSPARLPRPRTCAAQKSIPPSPGQILGQFPNQNGSPGPRFGGLAVSSKIRRRAAQKHPPSRGRFWAGSLIETALLGHFSAASPFPRKSAGAPPKSAPPSPGPKSGQFPNQSGSPGPLFGGLAVSSKIRQRAAQKHPPPPGQKSGQFPNQNGSPEPLFGGLGPIYL